MILTPISPDSVATLCQRFAALLPTDVARASFARIAATEACHAPPLLRAHRAAVALAGELGMKPCARRPQSYLSWDGERVRAISAPAVLLHEVAHYQLASPARRRLPDFGLGPGPESGSIDVAERARQVRGDASDTEEQMASLLGVLWEVELDQKAILAFQEQNWLEGAGRPSASAFFAMVVDRLIAAGLVDEAGRPLRALNIRPDPGEADFARDGCRPAA